MKGCLMATSSKNVLRFGLLVTVLAACSALLGATAPDPARLKRLIEHADYYLREFEKEVALQRGGEKMMWRSKRDALERVMKLHRDFPGNPNVEALFRRAKVALMKSKGDYTQVVAEWTTYKRNEETLRKIIAEAGEKAWNALIAERGEKVLKKNFPTPDYKKFTVEDLKGTFVVLNDIEYPRRQFYGATGEYVASGKPSTGFYFVNISNRDWLGPYEAVKRYRRNVDSGLEDVQKWTIIGEIVDITAENPTPSENAVGNIQTGWEIKPVALFVPGHVMAVRDDNGESTGRFIGEEKVDAIKDGWYTVKDIPADVTPERLMEIFMTAIKEKNYKLYLDCVDPELRRSDQGSENLRYHWDLHQERFHKEYVHAIFGKATIEVQKGFDESNDLENYFLDESEKKTLKKIGGQKVEVATVESKAYDENGKQLGTPHPHRLIRRGGGRWYVTEYAPRF